MTEHLESIKTDTNNSEKRQLTPWEREQLIKVFNSMKELQDIIDSLKIVKSYWNSR